MSGLVAIGSAAAGSMAVILTIALIGGMPVVAIVTAFLADPIAGTLATQSMTPALLALTAPTVLIWA